MTVSDHTPPVTYRQLDWLAGYRFGDDGSVWTCRKCCRWNQFTDEWRLVKPRRNKDGYLKIRVAIDRKDVSFFVHRLILEAFVGPCPEGMEGCHDPDRNPANCRLDNLRWDTRKSNIEDSRRHGTFRRAKGSKQHLAKLTEEEIPVIRQLRRDGLLFRQIAERFGVNKRTIILVVHGRTWKHVS